MENVISRNEHEEFAKRIEAEDTRQNHRIGVLERAVQQYGELTVAVGKMATSMESMLKEQQKQGERLGALESRDGELWRKAISHVVTTILGILVGVVFSNLKF